VDPMIVALHHSRGYESYVSKLLMRWTVVASDVLCGWRQSLA
jgi:alpha-1,3-glucosyltransferase